jgi:putative flippase GtrA
MRVRQALLRQPWLRFLLAGTGNTLLSQGFLLVLLGWWSVGGATLASQTLHACCGYWSSRVGVFRRQGKPWAYGLVVLMSWVVQWQALRLLLALGVAKVWAVGLLVGPLAALSYWMQRRVVFR